MNQAPKALVATLAALAMLAFPMVPVSLAQEAGRTAAPGAAQPMRERAGMPMMAHMKATARIKADLEAAKTAAQAKGNKAAVAKIDEALQLIEQDQRVMEQRMNQMMGIMQQRMAEMQALAQDMQKMKEEMAKPGQDKAMQDKMAAMHQKMEKMCTQMKSDMYRAGKAAEPKVVNTKCPIMGGKVDPYTVADNLTREFEGKKIGFCCAGCPGKWDQLTTAEKEQKLAAVLKEGPSGGQEKPMGGMHMQPRD
jgi:hypothetical protein